MPTSGECEATHFKCDICAHYKRMDRREVLKVKHTNFTDPHTNEKLLVNIFHLQVCKECKETL